MIRKHRQVFETLRREILLGKFDGYEKFPSEGQLIRRFGVSRITVRQALAELKHSRLIETRAGAGTYLSDSARNATGYLGLILPGYGSAHGGGEIFSSISTGVATCVAKEGYSLLFGNTLATGGRSVAEQALSLAIDYAERHVAGVIMAPVELESGCEQATRKMLSVFASKNIPVVFIDRDLVSPPDRSKYDLVAIDNVQAGHMLASYMISRGAKRIRYLVRPDSAHTTRLRAQGVAAAVMEAGLTWCKSSVTVASPEDGKAMAALVGRRQRADAVICANDTTAAEFMRALSTMGLRVPDDVMVGGFDDVRVASLVTPRLTTMRQPCADLARMAVEMLIQRIRDPSLPKGRTVTLPATLVVRDSTR